MRISEGIKQSGRPYIIPDSSRDELPEFFNEMGYKVGAEIGVYKAEFAIKLAQGGFKLLAVDPWLVYPNYRKHPQELPYDELEAMSRRILAPYDCTIIKKTSMDALADIPDGSLDFVYIDGNHSFPYIAADIYEWNRKVRSGGVISGHDYFNYDRNPYWIRICHVKYAVDACADIFKVKDFYIIGDGKDKYKSWLWIKE
jgi:hypothetical protein